MTTEEIYIKNIESGIRALKLRTKTPSQANVGVFLNSLKGLNVGMYEELLEKYKEALEDYKKK
jgi:hypothetical protein